MKKRFAAVLAALSLAACGGGGSQSSSSLVPSNGNTVGTQDFTRITTPYDVTSGSPSYFFPFRVGLYWKFDDGTEIRDVARLHFYDQFEFDFPTGEVVTMYIGRKLTYPSLYALKSNRDDPSQIDDFHAIDPGGTLLDLRPLFGDNGFQEISGSQVTDIIARAVYQYISGPKINGPAYASEILTTLTMGAKFRGPSSSVVIKRRHFSIAMSLEPGFGFTKIGYASDNPTGTSTNSPVAIATASVVDTNALTFESPDDSYYGNFF